MANDPVATRVHGTPEMGPCVEQSHAQPSGEEESRCGNSTAIGRGFVESVHGTRPFHIGNQGVDAPLGQESTLNCDYPAANRDLRGRRGPTVQAAEDRAVWILRLRKSHPGFRCRSDGGHAERSGWSQKQRACDGDSYCYPQVVPFGSFGQESLGHRMEIGGGRLLSAGCVFQGACSV